MKVQKLAWLLAIVLAFSLLPGIAAAASPYADVDSGAWYAEDVAYVTEHGLMNGVDAGKFDPDGTTTRAMIVTILHRMEGSPAAKRSAFVDVPGSAWFAAAVNWAAAKGVVNGVDATHFAPNDPITREQMAAILYRYAGIKGMDVSKKASLAKYTDANQISPWAVDAMAWANAVGLINGVTATTLDPGGYATRAQAAAILARFDRMARQSDQPRSMWFSVDSHMLTVKDPKQIFTGTFTVENDRMARIDWVLKSDSPAYDGTSGTAVINHSNGTWRASPVLLGPGSNTITFTAVTESGLTAEASLTVRCTGGKTVTDAGR